MNWSYRCFGWWIGPLMQRLPRLLSRPLGYVVVSVYFHWKVILVGVVIAFSSGSLGLMCWNALPRDEFPFALMILVPLSLFALWQWSDACYLRARLHSLEEDLREEDAEYDYDYSDDGEIIQG